MVLPVIEDILQLYKGYFKSLGLPNNVACAQVLNLNKQNVLILLSIHKEYNVVPKRGSFGG